MIDAAELFELKSGAARDVIASHNASGPYFRPRSAVTVPNTEEQVLIQSIFAVLTALWTSGITQDQRDAWIRYANQLTYNADGSPHPRWSGQNAFIGLNVNRMAFTDTYIEDAPVAVCTPPFPAVIVTQSPRWPNIALTFPGDEAWRETDGTHLFVFASAPFSLNRNFYAGPWQHVATISGNSGAPVLSPTLVPLTQLPTEDQRVSIRLVFSAADGQRPKAQRHVIDIRTPSKPITWTKVNERRMYLYFDKDLQLADGFSSDTFIRCENRRISNATRWNYQLAEEPASWGITSGNFKRIIFDYLAVQNPEAGAAHISYDAATQDLIGQNGIYVDSFDITWPLP